MNGEGVDYGMPGEGGVVIAEDGVAKKALDAAEDFGALVGELPGAFVGKEAVGDVVSVEEDGVGLETIDLMNYVIEKRRLSVLGIVEVGDLYDFEATELFGQTVEVDGMPLYADFVTGNHRSIERDSDSGDGRSFEKAAARDYFFVFPDRNHHLLMITA